MVIFHSYAKLPEGICWGLTFDPPKNKFCFLHPSFLAPDPRNQESFGDQPLNDWLIYMDVFYIPPQHIFYSYLGVSKNCDGFLNRQNMRNANM
jgi:hypothetical protein